MQEVQPNILACVSLSIFNFREHKKHKHTSAAILETLYPALTQLSSTKPAIHIPLTRQPCGENRINYDGLPNSIQFG